MTLEPIKEMPEFDHDVDPLLLAKLSDAEKYVVTNMSKMRQEQRWVAEKTIVAHNLAVEHEAFMRKYASPIGLFFALVGTAVVALITVIIEKAFGK
jgi:hypothetical protein